MLEKPRFNATFSLVTDKFPKYKQLIIFDRKTNKTIRLYVPIKYESANNYLLDLSHAMKSIQKYAKYKKEPQSISLLEEQLYFQKTNRYMLNNNFDPIEILNSTIWEG